MSYSEKYNNQYRKYVNFIKKYRTAMNAATGSEVDANANVENKNIATCSEELCKREKIGCNRLLMIDKITEMFDSDLAEEYIRQLECHEIYKHDETSIFPYTYSAKESVIVKINGLLKLISFEDLYDYCDDEEILLDEEKEVYGKFPRDFYIKDKGGNFTKITRLIKKKRHRDLVCVKTKNGENLIVTDNHPMIIGETKEDTIPASYSLGKQQTKIVNPVPKEKVIDSICLQHTEKYENFVVDKLGSSIQFSSGLCRLTKEFGYFVGFFIAEGWYVKNNNDEYDGIIIKQKGRERLDSCVNYLYNSTGITSYVSENKDARGFYSLYVFNRSIVDIFLNVFKVSPFAQNKRLPEDILMYPQEFQEGVICGIIDGDGTVTDKGQVCIRLSSRKAISQMSQLLSQIGVGCSMTYYDGVEYSGHKLIEDSFPMFGITFWMTDFMDMSDKYKKDISLFHKYESEKSEIIKVTQIVNEKFLADNDYIYDITTESNTFALNNIWVHNCVSITMYPFLFGGMKNIGGLSTAPTNLESFIGGFINLVFAVASQFAGAVSTPEFLLYMDYFLRKDYGDNYWDNWDKPVTAPFVIRQRTMKQLISDKWQQVIYSINQPAAARGYQAVK